MNVTTYNSGFYSVFRFEDYNDEEDIKAQREKILEKLLGLNYYFHSPYEMFTKNSKNVQSSPAFSLLLFITPQVTNIDDALINYSLERRGCLLPNEKPLRFFKKFTRENCRSECLTNKTLEICGCVQFYMIRTLDIRVCGIIDMKCFKSVENLLAQENLCKCYPQCGELRYDLHVQRMDYAM